MLDEHFEEPQHRYQSNRVCWYKSFKWSNDFSVSLNKRWFRSNQTILIKQPRTKFQISDLYFPSQFLQQNSKHATKLGMTHWTPSLSLSLVSYIFFVSVCLPNHLYILISSLPNKYCCSVFQLILCVHSLNLR